MEIPELKIKIVHCNIIIYSWKHDTSYNTKTNRSNAERAEWTEWGLSTMRRGGMMMMITMTLMMMMRTRVQPNRLFGAAIKLTTRILWNSTNMMKSDRASLDAWIKCGGLKCLRLCLPVIRKATSVSRQVWDRRVASAHATTCQLRVPTDERLTGSLVRPRRWLQPCPSGASWIRI